MATQLADLSSDINEVDDVSGDGNTREETAPDGGYGWICVAACFTINCFTWGTVSVSLHCHEIPRPVIQTTRSCIGRLVTNPVFFIISSSTYFIFFRHMVSTSRITWPKTFSLRRLHGIMLLLAASTSR